MMIVRGASCAFVRRQRSPAEDRLNDALLHHVVADVPEEITRS